MWHVTQRPTYTGRVKVVLYDTLDQTAFDISDYDITVKLARPGNLQVQTSSPWNSVTLTWQDRSNYNDGYEIERIDENGNVVTFTTGDGNGYTDNSVEPFHTYRYRMRAYRNEGGNYLYSDWVEKVVYNTPHWVFDDEIKWVRSVWAGEKIYVFYTKSLSPSASYIYYSVSTDYGRSFTDEPEPVNIPVSIDPPNFSVAGHSSGKVAIGYVCPLGNREYPNEPHVYVRIYDGLSWSDTIPIPAPSVNDNLQSARIDLAWHPTGETLMVAVYWDFPSNDYTVLYNLIVSTGNVVQVVDREVSGVSEFFEVTIQDIIFPEIGWGSTFRTHDNVGPLWISYDELWIETSGGFYDLSSSREIAVYRRDNFLKLIRYYYDYEGGVVRWTLPNTIYTWNEFDTEPSLEVSKETGMEFLVLRDGDELLLKKREIGGIPPGWVDVEKINLLNPYYFDLATFTQLVEVPTLEPWIWSCVSYVVGEDRKTLVFKRRDFKKRMPIISDPTIIDLPGYGEVNMVKTSDGRIHLVWSQEGQVWYSWTNQTVDGWTTRERIVSGWAPTLVVKPDSSGFYLLFLTGKPGSDSLYLIEYSNGFGSPHFILGVDSTHILGPVTAEIDSMEIYLSFTEAQGNFEGDTIFNFSGINLWTYRLDLGTYGVLDSVLLYTESMDNPQSITPYGVRRLLRSPSMDVYGDYVCVLWVPEGKRVKLYEYVDGSWRERILGEGNPPYRDPHIAIDNKTVYAIWSEGEPGEIYYRFFYPGDTVFMSRAYNISNTSGCDSREPWYAGKKVFWSEDTDNGREILYVSLALQEDPANLSGTVWGDSRIPRVLYYEAGGDYYRSSVYLTLWVEEESGREGTYLMYKVLSTKPIPEQVITLGDTIPTPKTLERDTFVEYGRERGKSADIDEGLTYEITDLSPSKDYRLGFYIYHEESTSVIERFYIDGFEVRVIYAETGEDTYVEVEVPEGVYDDSTIVVNVVKDEGPVAILNEIYVFGESRGTQGGAMGDMTMFNLPKKFEIKGIRPVPLQEKGVIEIGIPKEAFIKISLYDVTGRFVKNVFSGVKKPGYYNIRFETKDDTGRRLPQGVYFIRMEAGDFKQNHKLVVIR
jgi:hypothetical protein